MRVITSEALEGLDRLLEEHNIPKNLGWVLPESGKIGPGEKMEKIPTAEEIIKGIVPPILVYIHDQTYLKHHGTKPLENKEDRRRVHLVECKTIIKKRRFGKYNVQYHWIRRSDGKFPARFIIDNKEYPKAEYELCVCKDCLGDLKIKDKCDWYNFDFGKYLNGEYIDSKKPKLRMPKNNPSMASSSGNYTSDWKRISDETKERRNFTCEECGVYCEAYRHLLHVHHKDGQRQNNRPTNLEVLCLDCHSKQPEHGHMSVRPAHLKLIQKLRKEQAQ